MVCLNIGCGGGDVTLGIARIVGRQGRVVGADTDAVKLDAARDEAARQGIGNVEFRRTNVYDWAETGVFDRIYTRFLLTHMPDLRHGCGENAASAASGRSAGG
jgi:ubiquinone/menaquinone biosynthesis C-methylase UbiE